MTVQDQELEAILEGLDEELAGRLRELLLAKVDLAARELLTERLRLSRGSSRRLRLGSLATGLWRARGVCAEELRLQLKAEGVALENSRIALDLEIELGFQIPRLTSREPRTFKAGPAPGRVVTPTLRKIDLSSLTKGVGLSFVLSSICAEEAAADVAPLRDVDAGPGAMSGVVVEGLRLPIEGAALERLGRVALERLGLGGATSRQVRIEGLGADGEVRARNVTVRNASLSSASVGAVEGGELDLDFEVSLPKMKVKTFPDLPESIRRLTTRIWVEVTPTLVVHVGNLRFEGLTLKTELGELRFDELELPFALSEISADEVTLDDVEVEGVEL